MDERDGLAPFAQVNGVADGSPAHVAGLVAGDRILAFGPVDARTVSSLQALADVTAAHQGVRSRRLWPGARATVRQSC